MKKHIILAIFLLIASFLAATEIKVKFTKKLKPTTIDLIKINGVEYFDAYSLNRVFHAYITEDYLANRLNINIYSNQLMFLIDSSYVTFKTGIFNFVWPLKIHKQKPFLPKFFLTNLLPTIIPNKIKYEKGSIVAELPIDNSLKKIVIDPGHGGKDPGAVGFGLKEKNITLQLAKKLKKKIEKELKIKVYLTRSKDEFVSLKNRTNFANNKAADVFISLHCNASPRRRSNGVEVFFLTTSKTTDKRAKQALELENSVVEKYEGGLEAVKQYDDLAFILMDMAQSEHLEESAELAQRLQQKLASSLKAQNRGVKQAGFYVLKGAFMPAVLVEVGFISNKAESKKLANKRYQGKIVDSLFEGIKSFKNKFDRYY